MFVTDGVIIIEIHSNTSRTKEEIEVLEDILDQDKLTLAVRRTIMNHLAQNEQFDLEVHVG